VPERDTQGIHIADLSSIDKPIARAVTVTAFVGRTLRGPINRPIPIATFAQFQQVFGGLWQPSPLSYAVEQFFEQGGARVVVVRVVNGGAPATISLPCRSETLTLQALSPGTREFLRAAIDYDNIEEHEIDQFNLVLQRVRAPDSERIEEQETFRRVSTDRGTHRFISQVLMESNLARVLGEAPGVRPDATFLPGSKLHGGYRHSNPDGNDGGPLSDYDVIGSATEGTGLFALASIEHLAFVYIPPLTRTTDVGASTLLVAAKFCRERHAVLIIDPPAAWTSVEATVRGARNLNFFFDQAVMFFPRIVTHDRLRGRAEMFASGGVVAGMLSRIDTRKPVWALHQPEPDYVPRGSARLACPLTEAERWRLAANGINALQTAKSAAPVRLLARTLAGGAHVSADWGYLAPRRFALFIVDAVERGTRWVVWSTPGPAIWRRIERQVSSFMSELVAQGSFGEVPASQAFFVICDERVNHAADVAAGRFNIVLGFAASRRGEYHTIMLTHALSGSTVRSIAVNRCEMPSALAVKPPSAVLAGLQD
jgi:hypothetical protein